MFTENIPILKIHKLTQEQYDRELATGNIDETALYLTPDEEIDLTPYATIEYVDSKDIPCEVLENRDAKFENDIIIDEQTSVRNEVSKIGELTNYWQYADGCNNVIDAINQNADWVLTYFEQKGNKSTDVFTNKDSDVLYPTVKAVYDLVSPQVIYSDTTGFEANNTDIGEAWQLTGLDLSKYKLLKFYVCSAGDGNTNWSPSHIVEMHLDDRARGSNGHFTAGHTTVCPNATGRFHNVIFSVSSDKTSIAFNRSNRFSASTSATSIDGRYCYLIEGYLI